MQKVSRIHAPFDAPTLAQIDSLAQEKDISRSQWLVDAVSAYLRLLESNHGSNPENMAQEMTQLKLTNEKMWKESQAAKKAEERASGELAQATKRIASLEDQVAAKSGELEKVRSDTAILQNNLTHYQDTIKLKDQQISFLEAHVAQLTQTISQLALPPGQEEAKAKHRWQFWK